MRSKKAEMGMGTLIIFIAMILVAAVAASVLVATTSKLQNKALETGTKTTDEVGTSLLAIELYAENGTSQALTYWYETIKLSSGSEAIKFNDILLTMSLSNSTSDYTYNATNFCGSGDYQTTNQFGVRYQISGNSQANGYLNKGDVVKLCFQSPRSVGEGEDVKVSLIPMVGSVLTVETSTPDLMVNKRIPIYP